MKGRIKHYNTDKGFGFIIGEDQQDYFFHISDVISINDISIGSTVEFTPDSNQKGKKASKINIKTVNKKQFIDFGNVRIKLSNIKNYGIDYETRTREEIVGEREVLLKTKSGFDKFLDTFVDVIDVMDVIASRSGSFREIEERKKREKDQKIQQEKQQERDRFIYKTVTEKHKILYVTTYQNDNFRFYDGDINIKEKIKIIDEYFGVS